VFNYLKYPSTFNTCHSISTMNSYIFLDSLSMHELSIEDIVKKKSKIKKKVPRKPLQKKKNEPLGKGKGPLKDTSQKAMHNKLVKVWRIKQECNAFTLKNQKFDAHGS